MRSPVVVVARRGSAGRRAAGAQAPAVSRWQPPRTRAPAVLVGRVVHPLPDVAGQVLAPRTARRRRVRLDGGGRVRRRRPPTQAQRLGVEDVAPRVRRGRRAPRAAASHSSPGRQAHGGARATADAHSQTARRSGEVEPGGRVVGEDLGVGAGGHVGRERVAGRTTAKSRSCALVTGWRPISERPRATTSRSSPGSPSGDAAAGHRHGVVEPRARAGGGADGHRRSLAGAAGPRATPGISDGGKPRLHGAGGRGIGSPEGVRDARCGRPGVRCGERPRTRGTPAARFASGPLGRGGAAERQPGVRRPRAGRARGGRRRARPAARRRRSPTTSASAWARPTTC